MNRKRHDVARDFPSNAALTNKDSIERSAEGMFAMSQALAARSLNAIRG